VTVLQPFQLKNGAMAKGSGDTPLAKDVSVGSDDFTNGAHHRMPWAVSRDLQTAAITGKELYFRVTDPLLKDNANGGAVKTGFDFEFSDVGGTVIEYVTKSYDPVTGTLMGVFKPASLAGSTAATRGYLYFDNPAWTTSRDKPDQTFVNATSALFLPSRIDRSGAALDFNRDLPTSDKVIVNPGALCDGDEAGTDYMTRDLTGNCGDFLVSFLAQAIPNNSDNSPISFGAVTGGGTVIFARHLFADAAGDTDTSPHHKNAWRMGFSTSEGDSFYETEDGVADTSLQHVVMRRVTGSHLELYINGVLVPWAFTQTPGGRPQSARVNFTNQVLYIGRGAVASSRFWEGYLDCFKFFKDDAKTAAWALAEYSNLNDIDGGVIFGTPETKTTSSVWGETIKITVDPELTSVDFKADKYSATLGGTISLRSPTPFDPPSHGTLTDRGANNVRYTNTQAQDPDNTGAIHLTNGSGSVIIPVRAHIVVSDQVPVSGYYSRPNIDRKTAKLAANRNALLGYMTDIANDSTWTSKFYIQLTGDISGSAITINKGGTETHPLVIMSDDSGNPDSWPSTRPTVTTLIHVTAKYVWWYGVDFNYNTVAGGSFGISLETDWQFITACRLTGQRVIGADVDNGIRNNFLFNYNACFPRNEVGAGECSFVYVHYKANTATPTGITMVDPLMIARNYWSDVSGGSTAVADRQNIVYIASGIKGREGGSRTVRIEYNYMNCRMKRGIYNKYGSTIKWNHIVPVRVDNSYGDTMAGFRGPGSRNAVCAYNRIVNGNQLMVNGRGHLILSNVVTGTCTIQISCLQEPQNPSEKPTPEADGCRVMGNTGKILLPAFDSNSDDPSGRLGDFDPGVYPGLPNGKNVVLAGPNQQYFEDVHGDAGPSLPIISNHPQSTQVGNNQGYRWRRSSEIWVYQNVDPAWNYVEETPPTLNTTVCGPRAKGSGKLWGT
jgi:hypothetical protein